MEGRVFGIDKVIYIFFEYHESCRMETKCDDIFADTITQFLIKEFRRPDIDLTYDFFLEAFPTRLDPRGTWRDIYIGELRQMVAKTLSYDPTADKVSRSEVLPRVRLHYIDIRDYLFENIFYYGIDLVYGLGRDLYVSVVCNGNPNGVAPFCDRLTEAVLRFRDQLDEINGLFFVLSPQSQPGGAGTAPAPAPVPTPASRPRRVIRPPGEEIPAPEKLEITLHLIRKIKEQYRHPEVKTVITRMLDDYLKEGLVSMRRHIDTVVRLLADLKELASVNPSILNEKAKVDVDIPGFTQQVSYGPDIDAMTEVVVRVDHLLSAVKKVSYDTGTVVTDAYFLRRFLDKDYVTNGVSYTGARHSDMYVHMLAKYFDFKVTHASYTRYDLKTLNEKIKGPLGTEFSLSLRPPVRQQCSDLSSFPEGFT